DQSGTSLTRFSSHVYGDEPTNWVGAAPTPGQSNLVAINLVHGDINGDGHVDGMDMLPMMRMLVDIYGYQTSHQLTAADLLYVADINGDGRVTNADLLAFNNSLLAGGGSTSTESATSAITPTTSITIATPPVLPAN